MHDVVYVDVVRRLQILIEEDLDAALKRAADREEMSKGALVRRLVRAHVGPAAPFARDPLRQMAGADDFDGAAVDDVDDVFYG